MKRPASNDVIEILILDIKPGKRDEFHKIYEKESLPLLRKWKINVISYGPSLMTRIAITLFVRLRASKTGKSLRMLFTVVTIGRTGRGWLFSRW